MLPSGSTAGSDIHCFAFTVRAGKDVKRTLTQTASATGRAASSWVAEAPRWQNSPFFDENVFIKERRGGF
jgi:hypothetical protein